MFDLGIVMAELALRKAELEAWQKRLSTMTPEEQLVANRNRDKRLAAAQKWRDRERRHQELCAAIRSRSSRRF